MMSLTIITRMRLKNKTAFITGGSSGIGLTTARLFLAEGAKVAITGRKQEALDAAVKELGGDVIAIQADATDLGAMEKAVAQAVEKFGKLDIVFANAGIAGQTPIGKTTLAAFEQILKTNLTAVFFTVQAAAPHLNDGASIVLNGSVHAVLGVPGYSAYAASKAGIRSMTRVLASEFSPRGIRVNMVTPGGTKTPIWNGRPSEVVERFTKAIPLARFAEIEEVANAVLFLASQEGSGVQAAEIVVDGGATGSPMGAPIYWQ
jgi:NAD(P)-dependent dehydrogenase (short-subunit alcohol dehydrogenase family)